MAKYIRIRPTQLEKKTLIRHFAMKWSTSARVDFYLLERQTSACSYTVPPNLRLIAKPPPDQFPVRVCSCARVT